jgi:hypothetical protein
MKIPETDVASIEPFGVLDGKPVSLVKLRGGLNLATTLDSKGGEKVLGAASHQAILCYTVEQQYPSFQPMIMKSEGNTKLAADSHSHFLSDAHRKSGHGIYSVQNGNSVDFYVTKLNIKIGSVSGSFENGDLLVKNLDAPKEFAHSISGALSEKTLSQGAKKVRFQ